MYKHKKDNAAFTIIELIVVIAIIAILASIVLVNVVNYVSKSQLAAALADASNVPVAATNYYITNNSYSGICTTDSTIQNIGKAVKAINASNYGFNCRDSLNDWTAYNDSNNWIQYAYAAASCTSPQTYMAVITSPKGKICMDATSSVGSPGGSGDGRTYSGTPTAACSCAT